ncbi:MAG TPA: hypothetical protein VKX31_00795 [Brumimicrobium sp.]|nr:hypothetical protein [Brumimicrobium sp.]
MADINFSAKERDLIASAPVEKCDLSKEFLNGVIDWVSDEFMTKEDVVDSIFMGMNQGFIRLFYEKYRREKVFAGVYPERFNEGNKKGGEYLADYQNRMLIVCRFEGAHNEIAEVLKIYEFTNIAVNQVKQYEQGSEILKRDDDPGVVYKTQKNGSEKYS